MKKSKEVPVAEIARSAGFRATKPRLLLLEFLRKAQYPLSIQEIAKSLGRKNVDQVTLYRILDAFKQKGIVREVNFQGERPRYELTDTKNDHHHIVCTNCHKLEDFKGCDAEKIGGKALKQSRSFSKITGHSFDLYGLCNGCAK